MSSSELEQAAVGRQDLIHTAEVAGSNLRIGLPAGYGRLVDTEQRPELAGMGRHQLFEH